MGIEATIENLHDMLDFLGGAIADEQVRRITIPDAVVDPGAKLLGLPVSMVRCLGLERLDPGPPGSNRSGLHWPARLTIRDRDCTIDVAEVPDGTPVRIGRIALGLLDFAIDPATGSLVGNPLHGGDFLYDL